MGSQVIPPLPPGFSLDEGTPPLPPGFVLDNEKKKPKEAPKDPPKPIESTLRGMVTPIEGFNQMVWDALPGDLPKRMSDTIKNREKDYQERRGKDAGLDVFRIGGEVANPATMFNPALAATTKGRVVQSALMGLLFGMNRPTQSPGERLSEGVAGAVGGAFIPGGWELAKAVGRGARNVTQGIFAPEKAAGRIANEIAGPRRDEVISSLMDAELGQTAKQAAVPSGSAEFAGLVELASKRNPSDALAVEKAQQAVRESAIGKIAKTEDDLAAAVAERAKRAKESYGAIEKNKIDPRSEKQVWNDRVKKAEERTKASADADFYPVPGQPKLPGTYSQAFGKNEAHEESFKNAYQLLRDTVGVEDSSLKTLLERPSIQRALRTAMESAQERGIHFPSKPGEKFSVENLQRMKVALDDALSGNPVNALDKGVAADVKATRGAFIDWLGSRSPEWKKARLNFAEDSVPVNQMQIGQFIEGKLKNPLERETPGAFAGAVKDSVKTVKKAGTGLPLDKKIEDVMTPEQMEVINNIVKQLQTNTEAKELANAGTNAAARKIGDLSHIQGTGILNRYVTLGTSALRGMASGATDKAINKVAELSLNPQKFAEVMQKAKPYERQEIVDALMMLNARASGITYGNEE